MPVRYYKAPFQTQQPGGFGDVLQNAANNWARYGKTPDELSELRARTGLYAAQTGLTGEQASELHQKNAQAQGGTDAYREAGDALSGLQPGAPPGTIYDKLSGIFSGHGLDPEAAYKLGARYVGTHGGTEEDMARGHFGADLTGTPVNTTYLPGTAQARQKEGEAADFAKGKYAADASSGASMYDARLRAGAMQSDTAARVGEMRDEAAQRDKTTRDDFAAREAGLDKRSQAGDAAKLIEPKVLNPNQQLASPLYEMLDSMYPEGFKPDPQTEAAMRSEADQLITQDPQHPASVVSQVRQHWLGSSPTQEGGSHFWSGTPRLVPGADATRHFGDLAPAPARAKTDGTAPTVSPAPASNTAGNPDAANGGASAAASAMAPPPGAIKMLRDDPSLATKFDQKYGPGAASKVLGGGA